MMTDEEWIKDEKKYQQKINDLKVPYKPCMTISVSVLCGRNISVGLLHDLVDIPDPQVYVSCAEAASRKDFKTKIARDQHHPVWNETFTFVLSEKKNLTANIKIDLYEEDQYKFDPHLGSATLSTDDLEIGKPKYTTLVFGKHGQVDIKLLKQWRVTPDFHLSLGLCTEELKYRLARKPKTKEAIRKFLGEENGPTTLSETPTIGLAISGGGYRAVATSCGAMEALAESNMLDTLMYFAGLSGSSWYLSSAYLHKSLANLQTLFEHHDWLRKQMEYSLYNYLFDMSFHKRYRKYREFKVKNHQPITFVDFYGMTLGETFLDKQNTSVPFSALKAYVETAEVPFPIISCAHVRENMPMSEFWDEVEMTPFQVSLPGYGINVSTENFNSRFCNGILLDRLPEPPLHYIMGSSGSAFAIMNHKMKDKNEIAAELWEYIDAHQQNTLQTQTGQTTEVICDDELEPPSPRELNFASREDKWLESLTIRESTDSNSNIMKQEFGTRGSWLVRTARVRNCAVGCRSLRKFRFDTNVVQGDASKRARKTMSVDNSNIALCDAALGCNLPSIHVMRPQRKVDILLVVDCSNYLNETSLQMELFATVQSQVHEHGIKFPRISLSEIAKSPFREFYIFEDEEDPKCPIVFWFTLSNAKFKSLQNPHRRSGYPQPDAVDSGQEKFNNFSIYPESSDFGTLRTSFTPLTFDRIRELMRFNIMNNMWIVKEKIANKVKQMKIPKDKDVNPEKIKS
ncbi:cytosolic phospholipase A2-like [Styela clava]